MALVEKSVLVEYSAERMFSLVNDVSRYPEFLPWCGDAQILVQEERSLDAALLISFGGIRQRFSTRNRLERPDSDKAGSIEMTLIDGPFRQLDGRWAFTRLDDEACKIEFRLSYAFSSRLLEKIVGPVFNRIADSLVEAFIERAGALYGNR